MKKRVLSMVVMAALLLTMWSGVAFADNDIVTVFLDGKELEFDVPAQTINDRTMVPIRAIFENMGAIVEWDEATSSAICTKDSTVVKMTIDSKDMYINNQVKELDVAPVVINGRTLAPARYVAEAFGADVQWDAATQRVNIFTQKSLSPTQEAVAKLRNWININYNHSLTSGEEYISYQQEDDYSIFSVGPVINSRDVVIQYSTISIQENINFAIYLLDGRYSSAYGDDKSFSISKGNIVKVASSNAFELTHDSFQTDYTGDKDKLLGKFKDAANTTLKMFDDFLKTNNIGLTLRDFGLDYDLPEELSPQETAFNTLKEFVLDNHNDTINNKPVYVELYDKENGSNQYSVQYDDKNDIIILTMRKIYNGSWTYSFTNLTREKQTCYCSVSFYKPSNKSNTPDFNATYTINANSFGENSNIYFENIKGNKNDQSRFQELAKLMNLDMLNFTEYVFDNHLKGSGCSMSDFGFNLE